MLPSILENPQLRCTAHSRRSGWQQCGRLKAYGSNVCQYHGARKKPRFGKDAPNFKHGKRTLQAMLAEKHGNQRVKVLAIGVDAINGSEVAGRIFDLCWPVLEEMQKTEMDNLAERILGRRKPRS